jgi:hypothetical protein
MKMLTLRATKVKIESAFIEDISTYLPAAASQVAEVFATLRYV